MHEARRFEIHNNYSFQQVLSGKCFPNTSPLHTTVVTFVTTVCQVKWSLLSISLNLQLLHRKQHWHQSPYGQGRHKSKYLFILNIFICTPPKTDSYVFIPYFGKHGAWGSFWTRHCDSTPPSFLVWNLAPALWGAYVSHRSSLSPFREGPLRVMTNLTEPFA